MYLATAIIMSQFHTLQGVLTRSRAGGTLRPPGTATKAAQPAEDDHEPSGEASPGKHSALARLGSTALKPFSTAAVSP